MAKRRSEFVENDDEMYRLVRRRTDLREMGRILPDRSRGPAMNASRNAINTLLTGDWAGDSRSVEYDRPTRRSDARSTRRDGRTYQAPGFSRRGVRGSILAGFLGVLTLILVAAVIVGTVQVNNKRASNDALRAELIQVNARCDAAKSKLDAVQDQTKTAYNAKNYGLVSAGSLPVILLQAPRNAGVLPDQGIAALPVDALAIIFGQ